MNPTVIWFTGLPSSGKSTLAAGLKAVLEEKEIKTFLLDGDDLRAGLNADLGYTAEDRSENLRRAAHVAKLLLATGRMVLATFISPFQKDREMVKEIIGSEQFIEVYVSCSLAVCETRDVKGLYRKARAGTIKNFTGLDSPYEIPASPDIVMESDKKSVEAVVRELEAKILAFLR